jgi:hypothetical protein
MNRFLMLLLVVSTSFSQALADPGPKKGGGDKHKHAAPGKHNVHNYKPGMHGNHSYHMAKPYSWHGWSNRHYSHHLATWIYWCPDDSCWYRMDAQTQTFVACEYED